MDLIIFIILDLIRDILNKFNELAVRNREFIKLVKILIIFIIFNFKNLILQWGFFNLDLYDYYKYYKTFPYLVVV